jgi:hypothetical protein
MAQMNLLEQLFNKLDKLDERLDSVDRTLIKQEANLEEHMRRSLANEEAVNLLSQQLKPLNKHVIMVESIFKFVGAISVLLGIVLGVLNILDKVV